MTEKDTYNSRTNKNKLISNKNKLLTATLGGVAALAVMVAAHGGGGNGDRKKYDDNRSESVTSVTIDEGARFRHDPFLPDPNDGDNTVTVSGGPETINTPGGTYTVTEPHNGLWVGVPAEDLTASIPGFDTKGDKDGIIWVNEQKIHKVVVKPTTEATDAAQPAQTEK